MHASPGLRKLDYTPFPFFLAYATAILERDTAHQIKLVDAIAEGLHEPEFYDKVKRFAPDVTVIETSTPSIDNDLKHARRIKEHTNSKIILTGPHATVFAEQLAQNDNVDVVIKGEYELSLRDFLKIKPNKDTIWPGTIIEKQSLLNVNKLPLPAWHHLPIHEYYDSTSGIPKPTLSVAASRGCAFSCLTGDTLINTIEGMISIRELVGKDKVAVYTYEQKGKKVVIADAFNICKTKSKASIVRVRFDDDSYIDCTPDHKFLIRTKNGNLSVQTVNKEIEAGNLKRGDSVKAIYKHKGARGEVEIWCGNNKGKYEHRIVMEYILQRSLSSTEDVHHIDKNPSNNLPNNLLLCKNSKEHIFHHPEISQRMKENNPVKYHTPESRERGRLKITGLKRTEESKLKYSLCQQGEKNSNWRGGKPHCKHCGKETYYGYDRCSSCAQKKIYKYVNHKVVDVIKLNKKEDVYCMEVPGYDWFFANNVLVHNCNFCLWNQVMYKQCNYRQRKMESVVEEIKTAIQKYPFIKGILTEDDTFSINKADAIKFAELYKQAEIKLPWCALGRADTVDFDTLKAMRDSGLVTFRMGTESSNQDIVTRCGKGLDLKKVDQTIDWCKQLGIQVHITISYGLPGETLDTIKQTQEYIKSCRADFVSQSIAMPYPGTQFYEYLKQNNMLETEDWKEYDGFYNAVYHTESLTRQQLNEVFKGR